VSNTQTHLYAVRQGATAGGERYQRNTAIDHEALLDDGGGKLCAVYIAEGGWGGFKIK